MGMELDGEGKRREVGASLEDKWEGEVVAMETRLKHGGIDVEYMREKTGVDGIPNLQIPQVQWQGSDLQVHAVHVCMTVMDTHCTALHFYTNAAVRTEVYYW